MGEQGSKRLRRKCLGALEPLVRQVEEVNGQRGNVAPPVAQRREADLADAEPIVQILAELALRDRPGEVAVGGRDQPDIDLPGAGLAQRLDGALLDGSEELRLDFRAQLANSSRNSVPP